MSDTIILAIIAAIPGTIAALIGYGNRQQAKEIATKTDALTVKTAEIHVMVNSNLDEVKVALALANAKIDKLETSGKKEPL